MFDKSKLGTMVQQEDDGSYTSVAVMTNLSDEDIANNLCEIMAIAIDEYLGKNGLAQIIDDKEIN